MTIFQLTVNGKPMDVTEVPYNREGLENLLRMCRENGFQEAYMPRLIDGLIEAPDPTPFIGKTFYTFSLKVCGNVPGARACDLYAHIPTYFTDPRNMQEPITVFARADDPEKWDKEHAKVAERREELRKLYDRTDYRTVFCIGSFDYQGVWDRSEGVSPQRAIEMRLTEAIFGDTQRAERFFSRYGITKVFARHSDDIASSDSVDVGFLKIEIGNGYCSYGVTRYGLLSKRDIFVAVRDVT